MSSRDKRWREKKKPSKDAKKLASTPMVTSPSNVEVIRKPRKKREEEPEE
ncbi:hypothetical protein ACFLWX_01980 [Chloroflexota bacterium]